MPAASGWWRRQFRDYLEHVPVDQVQPMSTDLLVTRMLGTWSLQCLSKGYFGKTLLGTVLATLVLAWKLHQRNTSSQSPHPARVHLHFDRPHIPSLSNRRLRLNNTEICVRSPILSCALWILGILHALFVFAKYRDVSPSGSSTIESFKSRWKVRYLLKLVKLLESTMAVSLPPNKSGHETEASATLFERDGSCYVSICERKVA
jgi:hypothetical protein